jgi:hypothetical protein
MSDRLGKVVHVEGGYTIVEIVEERQPSTPTVVGYSLFGLGTDIRKIYTMQSALAALHERLAAA